MDVAGPTQKEQFNLEKYFIIILVDRFSGYVMARCVNFAPTTSMVLQVFRRVLNVFNSTPEIVHVEIVPLGGRFPLFWFQS